MEEITEKSGLDRVNPDLDSPDAIAEFPSDHLVLPIEWQNNTGRSVLVNWPRLKLTELDGRGGSPIPDSPPLDFFMIGEFPELSAEVLANRNTKPYSYSSSFTVPPHTVVRHTMVFRIRESAYGQNNYEFNFNSAKFYALSFDYNRHPNGGISGILGFEGAETESLDKDSTSLYVPCYVDSSTTYGEDNNYGWDFFSLSSGARIDTNYAEDCNTSESY